MAPGPEAAANGRVWAANGLYPSPTRLHAYPNRPRPSPDAAVAPSGRVPMTELLLVFILVLCNGFFALSEIAVLTSRKGRLKELARDSRGARKALELSEHPERFLSAVQVWITLITLAIGYVGGETLGRRYVQPIRDYLPFLSEYANAIGTGIGFLLMVFLTVVVGELVPKRIATLRAEKLAGWVALPMNFFAAVARPAVWVLAASTRLI